MTSTTLEHALHQATRVRAGVRILIAAVGVMGLGLVGWVMQQPLPPMAVLTPTLPTEAMLRGTERAITLSEALFQPRHPSSSTPAMHPVVAEAAGVWRLLGIELGPPPVALLKGSADGPTVWVKEGDHVGSVTVKQISSGRVVLGGADGDIELRV